MKKIVCILFILNFLYQPFYGSFRAPNGQEFLVFPLLMYGYSVWKNEQVLTPAEIQELLDTDVKDDESPLDDPVGQDCNIIFIKEMNEQEARLNPDLTLKTIREIRQAEYDPQVKARREARLEERRRAIADINEWSESMRDLPPLQRIDAPILPPVRYQSEQ